MLSPICQPRPVQTKGPPKGRYSPHPPALYMSPCVHGGLSPTSADSPIQHLMDGNEMPTEGWRWDKRLGAGGWRSKGRARTRPLPLLVRPGGNGKQESFIDAISDHGWGHVRCCLIHVITMAYKGNRIIGWRGLCPALDQFSQ